MYLWSGLARHPGPCLNNLDVEVFNVGGRVGGGVLTHGDCPLDTDAEFLAVVEHWLVRGFGGLVFGLSGPRLVWKRVRLRRSMPRTGNATSVFKLGGVWVLG